MKKPQLIKGFFFLALFLFFLLPPTDPDLGWHLRCGEEIWQNHTLCNKNEFSVLLENYSWPNHYWFYQAIIFPIYRFAGLWGLTIFNATVISLAFIFFYFSVKNYLWEKMLVIFTIIFFGWGVFSFGIRSQLTSFLFFNILLFILSKIEQKPKLAVLFPLITLLWANMHGSVIIGLVLLFFFLAKTVYQEPKKFSRSVIIFVFSVLITLVNPFGVAIYQEAWRHFSGQIDLSKLIAEWVPPQPKVWWTILASSACLFFYLLVASESRGIILSFLVLPFAFLALKARRHVPFYFLLTFYLFLRATGTKNLLSSWLKQKKLRENLALSAAFIFLLISLFIRLPKTYTTNHSWQNYCQSSFLNFPCEAVEFLKTQKDKGLPASRQGNIFNRYEWGGFLIWQLPEYKIFVDGRMPAWPAEVSAKAGHALRSLGEGGPTFTIVSPYTIYLETLQTQPGWQETLSQYQINWILISPQTFMDLLLEPEPQKFGWQEVFRDKISVIYKRIP